MMAVATFVSFGASASQPANQAAEAYMASVINHDQGAARRLVVPGSQADTTWVDHSGNISRVEKSTGGKPLGFRTKQCAELNKDLVVCEVGLTIGGKDDRSLVIRVQTADLKVKEAAMRIARRRP